MIKYGLHTYIRSHYLWIIKRIKKKKIKWDMKSKRALADHFMQTPPAHVWMCHHLMSAPIHADTKYYTYIL